MTERRLRVIVFAIRQFNQINNPRYETSSSRDIRSSLEVDKWNLKLVGMVGLELKFKDSSGPEEGAKSPRVVDHNRHLSIREAL